MAVDVTPNAFFSFGATGLTQPITVCGWFRFDSTPASYRNFFYHGTASYSNCLTLNLESDMRVRADDANFGSGMHIPTSVLSTGTWYFIAAVSATGTNNAKLYWRAEGVGALSSAQGTWTGTFSQNALRWSGGPGEASANMHDGAYAYRRVFATALTESDLLAESTSSTAVAAEWADWPTDTTANSTSDVSGNGRNLTFTAGSGSQANTTGPNISLGTQLGAIGETDAVLAGQRTSAKTAGAVAEVDALLASQRTGTKTAGVAVESDGLQASQRSTSRSTGAVAESDAFAAVTHEHSVTVGQLAEADGLQAAARSASRSVGTLAESDDLTAAPRSHSATMAALSEADGLAGATRGGSHEAGALAELDVILAIEEASEVGAIAETDALAAVAHATARVVAVLDEIDLLNATGRSAVHSVGQIAEVDAVAITGRSSGLTGGLLAETDVLLPAGEAEEVGSLAEIDALLAAGKSTARLAGAVGESDTLLPVGHVSSRTSGTLAEVDALAAVGEEVLGSVRFVSRARPLVSATTSAEPTVDMEVST